MVFYIGLFFILGLIVGLVINIRDIGDYQNKRYVALEKRYVEQCKENDKLKSKLEKYEG